MKSVKSKKKKSEVVGFKDKVDMFEPLYTNFFIFSKYILAISPIGDEEYSGNDFRNYVMYIQKEIPNVYFQSYVRTNRNKSFFIGFRIEKNTLNDYKDKVNVDHQIHSYSLRKFINKNISNGNFFLLRI